MGEQTSIEWTDKTFNPWWGCSRVSPACRFCYADRDASRYGYQLWRRHGERRMLSDANWARPLKWNRDAERAGVPAKVFCASMADVFEDHPAVAEPRERLWGVVETTPWLRWQILTKRPENIARMVPWGRNWPGHFWLGTSVENQRYANEHIPLLLASGARTLFLSCEPLLGPVDLRTIPYRGDTRYWLDVLDGRYRTAERFETGTDFAFGMASLRRIGWVIAGGESGPKARISHPDWFRSLRDQCQTARVPFFFKQTGTVLARQLGIHGKGGNSPTCPRSSASASSRRRSPMSQPDPLVIAYLAGIIDADGYISIQRSVRRGIVYHGPQVGIAGTRREPHDLAATLWGGKVSCYAPKNPHHRPQFQWSRLGEAAVTVIEAIRPYLRVKHKQADLALELYEHLLFGKSDDPFQWFGPDYGARSARDEMIGLNQSRNRLRSFPRAAEAVTAS